MSKTITFWLGILGVLFFTVPAVIGGLQFEQYSPISQFISETYATGTPWGNQLSYLGYIPSGAMMALFGFFAPNYVPKSKLIKIAFWLFAIFYGLGTIVVAIFRCDEGCNRELINPSTSQIIHNIAGGLAYLIVPFAIIAIGVKAKYWSGSKSYANITLVCGAITLIFAWLVMVSFNGSYVGLYQRLAEGSVLFWVIRTAFFIKSN